MSDVINKLNGYIIQDARVDNLATVATSGDYDDLSNKPTIPSLTGYATQTYVNDAVAAIDIPDVSDFITAEDLPDVSDMATETWVSSQGYLTQHQDISGKANAADLATVATTGSYDDLTDKPTIPSISGLATEQYVNNAVGAISIPDVSDFITAEDLPDLSGYAETANLATVATSGDYDDLINKPSIPSTSGLASETWVQSQGYLTQHQDISGKANIADLATVATSGSYNDLTNKPTIPSITGLATETYVDNAVAGISVPDDAGDIGYDNTTSGLTADDVQEAIDEVYAAIPDVSGYAVAANLSTVATTGDYDDLTNKPTIPVLPTLATVATSGDYNDLSNKPSIQEGGMITSPLVALFDFLIRKPGYGDAKWRINSLQTQEDFNTQFKAGWDSGEWGFLQFSGGGGPLLAATLGLTSFNVFYIANDGTASYSSGLTSYTFVNSGSHLYAIKFGKDTILVIAVGNAGWEQASTQPTPTIYRMLIKYFMPYSNTISGLTATTIQGAIDELAAASGGGASTAAQLSYDNTNTWNDGTDTDTVQEAIDALYADVDGLDIPDAVGYTYDSSTNTVSLSGVLDNNL